MLPKLNDDDIAYAQKILLKKGEVFDDERVAFIKNLDSIDLQAVPGSGKTTALLAKLLIMEEHLPFKDGSGILVISHTNAAVNQIKHKIGKFCPKLFSYPNFVGTIQSFVDQFLAKPFAQNFLGVAPRWIDSELYQDLLWRKFKPICWSDEFERPGSLFYSRHIERCMKEAKQNTKVARELCDQCIERDVKDLFLDFTDGNIKTFGDENVILKNPESKKYQGIKGIIEEVINKEIISYEYAYNMADAFIRKAPIIKRLIRKRFRYVFVDEMQDMEKHQYRLLDDLFHCPEVIFQRIGDKNQAIFSEKINLEEIWIDRETRLPMKGSHRLSSMVAEVVNNFAIDGTYKIEAKGDAKIPPRMIVFSEDSIDQVMPKFTELVTKEIPKEIIATSEYPIKLIGWTREPKDGKLGVKSFYKDFESKATATRTFHPNLKDHLTSWSTPRDQKNLLGIISKNILGALVAIMKKEEIEQEDRRYFSISSLKKYLRESHKEFYENLKLKLFVWSRNAYRGKIDETLESIKAFVPNLLGIFEKRIDKSLEFINGDGPGETQKNVKAETSGKDNTYKCPNTGVEVKVGTVHSAKGETHLATLYVETYYHKRHESERLSCCFCGKTKVFDGDHDRESARIAYVAMSRPTHLLCFAIHKDHFEAIKEDVSNWHVEIL